MIAFIVICCVGALIIEMREKFLMDKVMDRRVADLMLSHDTFRAQRSTDQSASDNRKRDNAHRFISFERI